MQQNPDSFYIGMHHLPPLHELLGGKLSLMGVISAGNFKKQRMTIIQALILWSFQPVFPDATSNLNGM